MTKSEVESLSTTLACLSEWHNCMAQECEADDRYNDACDHWDRAGAYEEASDCLRGDLRLGHLTHFEVK